MGGKIQMLDLVPGGKCRVSLCCTFLCLYYNLLLKFYLHLFLRPSINNNVLLWHGASSGCRWKRPPDMDGSCENIENSQQRVVLQFVSWVGD
jgi:hypothetical protein